MVAPYGIGDPVRSYVRIPGTGKDQEAKALCWDLSHSSSLAAAAPVQSAQAPQPSSPLQVQTGQQKESKPAPSPKTNLHSSPSDSQSQQKTLAETRMLKRPREKEPQHADCSRVVSEPAPKIAKLLQPEAADHSSARAVGASPSKSELEMQVKQLQQKCDDLHKENKDLNRRLTLFHALFRNKKQLANFVRHLETVAQ